jgi:hypothetical protein
MKKASLQPEIVQYLNMLGDISQKQVLEYIKTLAKQPDNNKGKKAILDFAGAFSKKDLTEMNAAISEGCEKVDANEW